jgi:hypothetical protein
MATGALPYIKTDIITVISGLLIGTLIILSIDILVDLILFNKDEEEEGD